MKVLHDFSITEQDIIATALKEYSNSLKARCNSSRAGVADKLSAIIYSF